MLNKIRFSSVLMALVALSACQSDWSDPNEGASVKNAIISQSVYPNGRPDAPKNPSGLSGAAAKSTIDNYQRSFALPAGVSGAAPASGGSSATGATQ